MSERLMHLSTPALITAIEANLFQHLVILGRWHQADLHDNPEMVWFFTNIPSPALNAVFRTQLAPDDIDGKIDETLTRFKSRRVPMTWWITPSTQPADLAKHLEAHGSIHAGDLLGMAVDLLALNEDLPTPAGLTIEHVGDVETLKKFIHAWTIGFQCPDFVGNALFDIFSSEGLGQHLPFRHYVGLLKGEPVATSSLLLAAGVAGLYNVVTLPDARRQGIGTALTLASLREARAMGYRVGVAVSTKMAVGMYSQLGCKEYCKVSTFIYKCKTNQRRITAHLGKCRRYASALCKCVKRLLLQP